MMISLLLFLLFLLLIIMVFILFIYFIYRITRKKHSLQKGDFPDPRYMGSTAFIVGLSGRYKEAVIPIPIEGITIGNNPLTANLIINDHTLVNNEIFISFPENQYDSVSVDVVECYSGGVFVLDTENMNWLPIQSSLRINKSSPVKIRIGATDEVFEITFRS